MQNQNVLKRHARLMDKMAETLGLDLEEAAMRGTLPMDDIADVVLSCTNCSNPDHCETWLGEHADGADATPGYCRNKDLFAELTSKQE